MATVQQRNHGSFRILFVWNGRREMFTLGKVDRKEAEAKAAQIDYLLMRLKQRLVELPPASASSTSSGTTGGLRSHRVARSNPRR